MKSEKKPRTARDALIIELMGDIGLLHDEVKAMPQSVEGSLSESLKLIAGAVEEAEKTTHKLRNETELAIKQMHETHVKNIEEETKLFLQESVLKTLNEEISKTAELTQNIRKTLNSYPDVFRPKAPLGPLLALAALIMAAILGNGYFTWKMYQESAENHWTMLQINRIYQKQLNIIDSLPPDIRKKFFDRQDVHARKRP